jgi:hypothetical protein
MRKNLLTALTILFLTIGSSHVVWADTGCATLVDPKGNVGCTLVNTAIGPIHTNVTSLVSTVFTILLGLGGGVAILLIIASGYQMMMSQGNPEKVKEARERLTSAIVGLLFMIFSATILQIIGVSILSLPGFH